MAKNIMLMFVSLVNVKNNKVNVANYEEIGETRTTNESAVRYVLKATENNLDKIFAFVSKKVSSDFLVADDVPENITHYQYFKNRLKELNLDVEKLLTDESVYRYDEQKMLDSVESNLVFNSMSQIVEMAARIQSYVQEVRKENPTEEVILHVDCTGGLRNAAMMIMAIMRLMQYQNITIGKVLYSNYDNKQNSGVVEEVNEIYHLFDLIAGAEEFVRFGSVDAIKSYFQNRDIPNVLKNLLDAMDKFAEAIKISRRSEFQKALENLKSAYKEFNNEKNFTEVNAIQSLNYNLMQQMKFRINQEYAELLKNDSNDYFSIIKWCLEHGYLQQSLTLYTECFPYLIITKDKIVTVRGDVLNYVKEKADKDRMNREWEYLLLNDYDPENYKTIFETYEEFIRNEIKVAIISIKQIGAYSEELKNSREYWTMRGIIAWDFDDYINLIQELQKLKSNHELAADIETVAENLPTIYSFWNFMPKNIFENPVSKIVKEIFNAFTQVSPKDFRKTNSNTLITKHMLMHGDLTLNIDEETFLKIVEHYFITKVERNDIAHARLTPNEKSSVSEIEKSHADFLKEYMTQGLKEYSKIFSTRP